MNVKVVGWMERGAGIRSVNKQKPRLHDVELLELLQHFTDLVCSSLYAKTVFGLQGFRGPLHHAVSQGRYHETSLSSSPAQSESIVTSQKTRSFTVMWQNVFQILDCHTNCSLSYAPR